jgi:hypothetical protein
MVLFIMREFKSTSELLSRVDEYFKSLSIHFKGSSQSCSLTFYHGLSLQDHVIHNLSLIDFYFTTYLIEGLQSRLILSGTSERALSSDCTSDGFGATKAVLVKLELLHAVTLGLLLSVESNVVHLCHNFPLSDIVELGVEHFKLIQLSRYGRLIHEYHQAAL